MQTFNSRPENVYTHLNQKWSYVYIYKFYFYIYNNYNLFTMNKTILNVMVNVGLKPIKRTNLIRLLTGYETASFLIKSNFSRIYT